MEERQPMGDVPADAGRGPTRCMTAALALVFLLSSLACGGSQGSALVTSSDPRLADIVVRILPDLATRSGMELRDPVRVERRSRAELERYLEFKIEEEFPGTRAE